ncbi:hypothetical protein K435DRAFT_964481 [Dendrothele bispora CBS 962.96]|uniref:Uncharacterized protein n=1 Tax=Dendrothele bispora (strain CBS 962.96) TaxID=1314807 RepID=A0A4S8MAQ7_DENBC|nr:hypothetical protein K435DRAFT_964481 [Dendrothele bispora CBS 962.96]
MSKTSSQYPWLVPGQIIFGGYYLLISLFMFAQFVILAKEFPASDETNEFPLGGDETQIDNYNLHRQSESNGRRHCVFNICIILICFAGKGILIFLHSNREKCSRVVFAFATILLLNIAIAVLLTVLLARDGFCLEFGQRPFNEKDKPVSKALHVGSLIFVIFCWIAAIIASLFVFLAYLARRRRLQEVNSTVLLQPLPRREHHLALRPEEDKWETIPL